MDHVDISHAKRALLRKSLLGYRRDCTSRQVLTASAKVGQVKTGRSRLVRTAEAKVGLDKPPPTF